MSACGIEKSATQYLARRALSVQTQTLPEDALTIARHSLLDWFSLVLASWHSLAVDQVQQYLEESGLTPGQATLLGSGVRVSPDIAAILNGTAGHVLDFDDAHLKSRVHPSVPLWPAILSYGEQAGLSGDRLLAAFVAGVEVQSRLAAMMGDSHYRLGWHNTATLGSFGATASIGVLRGLTEVELCSAYGIVATMAGGLRSAFGTAAKPLQAARAAANGLFAAGVAQRGFLANQAILNGSDGFPALYADDLFPERLSDQSAHWCVRDIVFKYHASCYGTQAPIEAAVRLGPLHRESVSEVHLYVEPQYISVCNIQAPATASEVKFSLRHMVAMVFAGRDTAAETSFQPDAIADPEICAWRDRITVHADAAIPRANARIEVHMRSGDCKTSSFDASRPETDLSVQESRLLHKSGLLLRDASFDCDGVARLQQDLLNIDSCADFAHWMSTYRAWLTEARKALKPAITC